MRGAIIASGSRGDDRAALAWAIASFRRDVARGCDLLAADELGRLELERGEGFAPVLADLASGQYRRALAVVRLEHAPSLIVDPQRVELRVFRLDPTAEARAAIPTALLRWLLKAESPTPHRRGRSLASTACLPSATTSRCTPPGSSGPSRRSPSCKPRR